MVVTVVEAHVAEELWAALKDAYTAGATQLVPGIVQTFLVHDLNDSTAWQIMTIWASLEALLAARQPGQTPAAVLMFRAAGAETTHAAFDIIMQAKAG